MVGVACNYSFDIAGWELYNNREHPSNADRWECPRETVDGENYCSLHLAPDRREMLGVKKDDLVKQMLDDFESQDPDKKIHRHGFTFFPDT